MTKPILPAAIIALTISIAGIAQTPEQQIARYSIAYDPADNAKVYIFCKPTQDITTAQTGITAYGFCLRYPQSAGTMPEGQNNSNYTISGYKGRAFADYTGGFTTNTQLSTDGYYYTNVVATNVNITSEKLKELQNSGAPYTDAASPDYAVAVVSINPTAGITDITQLQLAAPAGNQPAGLTGANWQTFLKIDGNEQSKTAEIFYKYAKSYYSTLYYNNDYPNYINTTDSDNPVNSGSSTRTSYIGLQKFVQVQALLQGPLSLYLNQYDNNYRMNRTLVNQGLLPETPTAYTAPPFNYALKSYDTINYKDPARRGNEGNYADWVLVEIRKGDDPSVLLTQVAGMLQAYNSNYVIAPSQSEYIGIGNNYKNGESYHITLRHRNHLSVRTAIPVTLANNVLAIDFSRTDNVYDAKTGNPPRLALKEKNGQYALWGGDANSNGNVDVNGSGSDNDYILSQALGGDVGNSLDNVYDNSDVNFDGNVSVSGSGSDYDWILANSLSGDTGNSLTASGPGARPAKKRKKQ